MNEASHVRAVIERVRMEERALLLTVIAVHFVISAIALVSAIVGSFSPKPIIYWILIANLFAQLMIVGSFGLYRPANNRPIGARAMIALTFLWGVGKSACLLLFNLAPEIGTFWSVKNFGAWIVTAFAIDTLCSVFPVVAARLQLSSEKT